MLPPAPIGERAALAHRFLVAQILPRHDMGGARITCGDCGFFSSLE
jgi:hypothetical protein